MQLSPFSLLSYSMCSHQTVQCCADSNTQAAVCNVNISLDNSLGVPWEAFHPLQGTPCGRHWLLLYFFDALVSKTVLSLYNCLSNMWCSADCPRLIDSPLSFYDDYRIINGFPVYILRPPGNSSEEMDRCTSTEKGSLVERFTTSPELDQEDSVREGSCVWAQDNCPFIATCCSFSQDSSRMVTGYKCGTLCVWETQQGRAVKVMENAHSREVRGFSS